MPWKECQVVDERLRFVAPYLWADFAVDGTHCGRLCCSRRKINLSHVFAGPRVGVTHVNDRIWLVSFMDYDPGYFDDDTCRVEPIENPFGPKVLPMCPVRTRRPSACARELAERVGPPTPRLRRDHS